MTGLQKTFFVTPVIVGIKIRRKKYMNYVKFQIATNGINPQFHLSTFFLPFNRCFRVFPRYVHDISIIYIVLTLYFLCQLYFVHAKLIIWRKTRQIWQKIQRRKKSWVPQNPWNQLFFASLHYTYYLKGIQWLHIYFCGHFTHSILGIVSFVKNIFDIIFTLSLSF